jgi:hypothetical protein
MNLATRIDCADFARCAPCDTQEMQTPATCGGGRDCNRTRGRARAPAYDSDCAPVICHLRRSLARETCTMASDPFVNAGVCKITAEGRR